MLKDIKLKINNNLNKSVTVTVIGMRNHKEVFEGVISSCSDNVFVVTSRGINRSFTYADMLIGDVIIRIK